MKTTDKPSRGGVVSALLHLGYSQKSGPFPPALAAVVPAGSFNPEEMEFAQYLVHDTDFGGAWNDAEQIATHTTP